MRDGLGVVARDPGLRRDDNASAKRQGGSVMCVSMRNDLNLELQNSKLVLESFI